MASTICRVGLQNLLCGSTKWNRWLWRKLKRDDNHSFFYWLNCEIQGSKHLPTKKEEEHLPVLLSVFIFVIELTWLAIFTPSSESAALTLKDHSDEFSDSDSMTLKNWCKLFMTGVHVSSLLPDTSIIRVVRCEVLRQVRWYHDTQHSIVPVIYLTYIH